MSELKERAREIYKKYELFLDLAEEVFVSDVEQALMRERQRVWEEAAKIAQSEPRCWSLPAPDPQTRIAAKLRSAAERET
jgi:hypothetical protein